MSVVTTSDEHISKAKQNLYDALQDLNAAYDNLRVATDPNTWGSGSFEKSYLNILNDCQLTLSREIFNTKLIIKHL